MLQHDVGEFTYSFFEYERDRSIEMIARHHNWHHGYRGGDAEKNGRRAFELPGARPHYNPDRPGQVNHILLELELDIPNRCYQGLCNITLTPVRSGIESLTLDAVNLAIDEVSIGSSPQSFDYDGEQLHIYLSMPTEAGKALTVAIAYHVDHPQRGFTLLDLTNTIPISQSKYGLRGKMKIPGTGFLALIIPVS